MQNQTDYSQIAGQLEEMLHSLQNYSHIYIYSAGNRAKEVLQMCRLGFLQGIQIEGFIVTGRARGGYNPDNPAFLDGKRVYLVEEFMGVDADMAADGASGDTAVWVAAMEHYHMEIRESLQKTWLKNIYCLTDPLERVLIGNAVEWYFRQQGIPYLFTGHVAKQCYQKELGQKAWRLFRVQSAADAPLAGEVPPYGYVVPIQAGAALAAERVCGVTDMDGGNGGNISCFNPYYNELSCLYWIWKNTDYEYSGICHYRRIFESDHAFRPILEGKADAVLASPCLVYPDLEKYYLGWGEESYYKEMLQVVKEFYPDYHRTALWCAAHPVFIPYNISILKREVLENYCGFLFRVIFEVEDRMGKRDVPRQKRCWLSEHVSTIYFMHHLMEVKDYRIYFSDVVRYW